MDNQFDKEVSQFWTPTQQIMAKIYIKVFEPINRAIDWLRDRYTNGTSIFKS
jgi:hypothetical protein